MQHYHLSLVIPSPHKYNLYNMKNYNVVPRKPFYKYHILHHHNYHNCHLFLLQNLCDNVQNNKSFLALFSKMQDS